jgi:hypothetical protein
MIYKGVECSSEIKLLPWVDLFWVFQDLGHLVFSIQKKCYNYQEFKYMSYGYGV